MDIDTINVIADVLNELVVDLNVEGDTSNAKLVGKLEFLLRGRLPISKPVRKFRLDDWVYWRVCGTDPDGRVNPCQVVSPYNNNLDTLRLRAHDSTIHIVYYRQDLEALPPRPKLNQLKAGTILTGKCVKPTKNHKWVSPTQNHKGDFEIFQYPNEANKSLFNGWRWEVIDVSETMAALDVNLRKQIRIHGLREFLLVLRDIADDCNGGLDGEGAAEHWHRLYHLLDLGLDEGELSIGYDDMDSPVR